MKISKARQTEKLLTIEYLLRRYDFDFITGEITLKSRGTRADKLHHFRSSSNTRYRQVQVPSPFGKGEPAVKISAHRMIWAVANGRWPREGMDIDHLDSNPLNNCLKNLEEVPEIENIRRGHKTKAKRKKSSAAEPVPIVADRWTLRPLAVKGDADAQYYLGLLYERGVEVKKNMDEAVYWYKAAAAQGHKKARVKLEGHYK